MTARTFSFTVAPLASWQLAAGHYIPAKWAPTIIGPSAAVTAGTASAYSRYRRAPSVYEWRVPIAVLGGAFPFKYEVVTGPVGMTIGETYGSTGYGILSWPSPTVGNHSINVRVTDQDGTVVTRAWTLEVIDRDNTTYFLHVTGAGNNANAGTSASPKRDFEGWYGTTTGFATHTGKQILYGTGTYQTQTMTARSGSWQQQIVMPTAKPQVHIGIPGASPVFDFNLAYWHQPQSDFCVSGISLVNGAVTEGGTSFTRCTYFRVDSGTFRHLFFENNFGPAPGRTFSDSSNSGTIFLQTSTTETPTYTVISDNIFNHNSGVGGVQCYASHSVVVERNTFMNHPNRYGVYLKSSGYNYWSIRDNRGENSNEFVNISDGIQTEANHNIDHIETCWNSVRCTTGPSVRIQASSGAAGGFIYFYRNSFIGVSTGFPAVIEHNAFNARLSDPVVTWEKNVIQGCNLAADTSGDGICNFSNDSTVTTNVTNYLDASTRLLIGAGLPYRGTHGAEVA
jgi:hypothetical protein